MITGSEPKALLWDNDGVLVDTEHLYFQATGEVLAEVGLALTPDLYVDHVMRRGSSLFDLARDRGASEREISEMRTRRNERYTELLRRGVVILDGVREVLAALHGRLPMACVTTSRRDHFDVVHEPHGLLRYFEFVLARGDYEKGKPHPEPYLTAAERLQLDPAECVVVEDSERGLQAAVAAGMRCLVVPNGLSRGGDFRAAHRVLGSAREIPAALVAVDLR